MGYCGANFKLGKTRAFMIFDRAGRPVGSYCRGCHEDFIFPSTEEAENANCHGLFKDKEQYEIREVEVSVEKV